MTEIVISPLDDVETFLADWGLVYELNPAASFFLSPAWRRAWLEGPAPGATIYVVRGRDEGKLVLLGAFGVPAPRALIGPRSARLSEFGVDAFDSIYVEDNDFLTAPEAPEDARARSLAAIVDIIGAEEVVLRNCTTSLAETAARTAEELGWRSITLRAQPVFAIDLCAARVMGAGAIDKASSALKTKVNRARRRYEARGPVVLRVARSEKDRAEVWRTLVSLHQEGWSRRGEAGAFANPAFVAFHERLQRIAPDATQLLEVQAAGEPIGCLYNFLHQGRVLNYQSGFRFEDDNQLTPGLLTHALAAQHYLEAGYDAYDLLAGDADYKRRLAEETGQLSTIVLEKRDGFRAGFRGALKGFRRAVRLT
ncbi:MAG: GNAT family N-acetyltransferase [Amphiplicatus sp.]